MLTTSRWAKLRTAIMVRDGGVCRMCGVQVIRGRRDPRSAVIDHIKPRALCPDLAWDEANLQTTCKACHDGPCASIEARHGSDVEAIAREKALYRPVGIDGWR